VPHALDVPRALSTGLLAAALVAGVAVRDDAVAQGAPHVTLEPSTGMALVRVAPGEFTMGSPPDEPMREAQEREHRVRLTRAFELGRSEVTQAQWRRVMGTSPSAHSGCEPCPVEDVNLFEVEEFLRRLNALSPLAGFRHTNAAGFWRDMKVGDRLDLVREPENPYDAGAIRVEWRGRKLGYVPRRENPAVARQLDRGAPLEARIISLRENRNRSVHIEFEVVARLSSR